MLFTHEELESLPDLLKSEAWKARKLLEIVIKKLEKRGFSFKFYAIGEFGPWICIYRGNQLLGFAQVYDLDPETMRVELSFDPKPYDPEISYEYAVWDVPYHWHILEVPRVKS